MNIQHEFSARTDKKNLNYSDVSRGGSLFFPGEVKEMGYVSIVFNDQNLNSGSTSIAQANFARRDLLNICEKGR